MMTNRDRQFALLSLVAIVAIMLVQFLFWRGVWFGRVLGDQELAEYLEDEKPRKIQHALEQLVDRVERGDPDVRQWYPSVSQLADSPHGEVRIAAAWMMGHDPRSRLFHETLVELLDDPALMVRRNAALGLVRFGDSSGVSEVRAMLRPHIVKSPVSGQVFYWVSPEQEVEVGTPLAFIKTKDSAADILSEDAGQTQGLRTEGSSVAAGDIVLTVLPETSQVWESLRALVFIGGHEDLELVGSILQDYGYTEAIRRQAASTYHAIRKRTASANNRVSK